MTAKLIDNYSVIDLVLPNEILNAELGSCIQSFSDPQSDGFYFVL